MWANQKYSFPARLKDARTIESVGSGPTKRRQEQNCDLRTRADSPVGVVHLKEDELKERVKNLNTQRRSKAATIKRLKDKIKALEVNRELGEQMITHLKEALESTQKDKALFNENIESTLKELLKEEADRKGTTLEDEMLSKEETQQFVDFISESITNHIHKLNGNPNLYRFSPYIMGLSMNHYLQSGKSSYNQFRADNVVVLPSADNHAKTKQLQGIHEGDCVVMYEKQLELRGYLEEIGELMCDEMKLQQDIVVNVSSNKMVGFSEDFVSRKKILKNLLDEDKLDNFCKPATHVNQWRYRSVNGRTYNCEFWFNAGSLDGETLIEQFNQVVIRCETVGSRVLGFVCDAGGNNARLMKLLRDKTKVPEGSWVPINVVTTANPYDPKNRSICLFHCSTHDLKNIRNALYTSWVEDGAKALLDEEARRLGRQ